MFDLVECVGVCWVYFVEEFMVVGIGVGMLIVELIVFMVVDIGGGIIEVVIMFLVDIVICEFVRVVGDDFDEVIMLFDLVFWKIRRVGLLRVWLWTVFWM